MHHVCGTVTAKYDLPRFVGLTCMKVTIMSIVNNAVSSALSSFASAEYAGRIATVANALQVAKQNQSSLSHGLYSGLLRLAVEGASGDVVRTTSKMIGEEIVRFMRIDVGLPAKREKGETNSPAFSTARVYGSAIGGLLDCKRDHVARFNAAVEWLHGETAEGFGQCEETELPTQASNAVKLLARCNVLADADVMAQCPALVPLVPGTVASELARVTVEFKALEVAHYGVSGELASLRKSYADTDAVIVALRGDLAQAVATIEVLRLDAINAAAAAAAAAPMAKMAEPTKV